MIKIVFETDEGQFTVGALYDVEYYSGTVAWVIDDVGELGPVYPREYVEAA